MLRNLAHQTIIILGKACVRSVNYDCCGFWLMGSLRLTALFLVPLLLGCGGHASTSSPYQGSWKISASRTDSCEDDLTKSFGTQNTFKASAAIEVDGQNVVVTVDGIGHSFQGQLGSGDSIVADASQPVSETLALGSGVYACTTSDSVTFSRLRGGRAEFSLLRKIKCPKRSWRSPCTAGFSGTALKR